MIVRAQDEVGSGSRDGLPTRQGYGDGAEGSQGRGGAEERDDGEEVDDSVSRSLLSLDATSRRKQG